MSPSRSNPARAARVPATDANPPPHSTRPDCAANRPCRCRTLADSSRTQRIKLGTAIYHIFGRSPVTLGIQAATLQDLSEGRLLLGLGVANQPIASWHDATFDKPIRRIREYADIVRQVATGELNPVHFRTIFEVGREYFIRAPWKPLDDGSIMFANLLEEGVELVRSLLGQDVAACGHGGLSDALAGVSQKKGETLVLDEHGHVVESIRP